MDDHTTAAAPTQLFCCPGEAHPIDRSTHLARLAAFYPGCLSCAERHDQTGLTPLQIAARAEVERHAFAPWQWTGESLTATRSGRFDRQVLRRLAAALAGTLWQDVPRGRPAVLVGSGGGPFAECTATFCSELERQGCLALEAGVAAAPALAVAAAQREASGALWIGSAGGSAHEASILAFGADGRPASSPGLLDRIRQRYENISARARRSGGGIERFDTLAAYLPALTGTFHGLRALTLVLDTASEAVWHCWHKLSGDSACRAIPAAALRISREQELESTAQRRLASIANQVPTWGAHFGLWIDGAGERCILVDERGTLVAPHRLLRLLGRRLTGRGIAPSEANRQQLAGDATARGSQIAGDAEGRVWFAGRPCADGLATLCLLLTLLSESDRRLSEVLDADAPCQ